MKKIFKWTFWSGVGLTAISLISSLGLTTFNLQSRTSNFTPPPKTIDF